MGSTLKRRGTLVMLAAGLVAGMLATSATVSAFTVPATSIFKVAAYSSTIPVDGSGRGWLGMAFSPTGVLYATAADGNLYVASASGPAPVTMSLVGAVGVGASGLAFGLDGKLYATSSAGVLEINPATGATIRVLAPAGTVPTGIPGPDGLAIDPVSGDLFVTSGWFVYWIAAPSAPVTTAAIYTSLRNTATQSYGISINSDGTLYVSSDVQIWRVTNPHALPTGITVPTPAPIAPGTGLRGVAVVTNNVDAVARFVFTNDTSGAITRYPVPPAGGAPAQVVTVGDRGDFMTVGPDHCVYAAQGGAILRISRDDGTTFGTCDLVAPTTPPATMSLTATGGSLPRVGALQTFQATVQNAPLPDGTPVTFTITGPNAVASRTVLANGGRADFAYAATVEGTDIITATTAIAGGLTSNSVTMVWGPAYDPIPPIISYSVAGTHGVGFQCIVSTTLANTDYCGYYTSPPTVTWTVIKGGTAALDPRTTCSPFPLTASTGPAGIPVTCRAANTDGATSSRTVVLQALLLPPTIEATMTLDNGQLPYTGGYTNHSVTVTFTCKDAAGNLTPSCSAPITVSTDGAGQTVSASATDAAGTTSTATFGPISIDKALPTISAVATLPGNAPYSAGTWTNQDVTVTYSCGDAGAGASGIVSCPSAVTFSSRQLLVTASVNDNAGNTGSTSVGPINIDKTPPTITATATAGGPAFTGSLTNKTVVVTFACVTDLAPVTCPGAQTFTNEGTFTASAGVTDAAGNAAVPATFGPFTIDKTPPTVTATYKTADGVAYVPGTPTAQNVLVTFTCADAVDPNPTCPGGPTRTITITSSQSVIGTSTDAAGNVGTSAPGQVIIDRTGPALSAVVTPSPDVNGNNVLSATVTVTGTDPSGISSITYSASGAQTIASTTVPGSGTTFGIQISLTSPGTTVVSYSATDAAGNVNSGSVTVRIVLTQVSTLTITSAPALTQGGTSVSARLVGPGGIPVVGRTVSFTAGGATGTGVTDATGTATATLALAPGQYSLTAAFGGDTGFYASTAGPQALVVAGATQFVIWGGNTGGVVLGQRVVFWGEHWWDQVNLAEKSKVKDFKGWASTVSGTTWTTKSGNSKPPETVPTYISVIITTTIDRGTGDDGKGITGNVVRHAILRVDSPYKDEPSKPVYGVVFALLP